MLDAPVSGGEVGAIAGTLTIMVGGDEAAFERARPVLQAMGRTVTRVGASGAGQVAKACNQILTGVGVAAVAEAMNFARQSGVDPARVREALLGGFAYSRILENHGQRMLDRNFKPGFKAWMHQKDLRIVLEEAHRLGLALPTAAITAQMLNAMVGSGLGEEDSIAMLKLLERMSGGEGA
jgi:2-hydroxy-3-oxopropionate reductase